MCVKTVVDHAISKQWIFLPRFRLYKYLTRTRVEDRSLSISVLNAMYKTLLHSISKYVYEHKRINVYGTHTEHG